MNMNKNTIITELYNKGLFEKLASKNISKLCEYKEDFIQEMYLFVCEMPDDKLIDMYSREELIYYLFYVSKAWIYNDKSDFWKKIKGQLDIDYSYIIEDYKGELNFNEYVENNESI